MIMTSKSTCRLLSATLLSVALSTAHAQSTPEELRLRATILILVESLVDSGVLTRAKADELVRTASFGPASPSAGTPAGGAASAAAGAVAGSTVTAAEIGPDGKRVVRVPYVPESLKREMREQIRQDVLAQAKTERWGNPGALPDWLSRVEVSGDVRLRAEGVAFDSNNTAAIVLGIDGGSGTALTRAADIATQKSANNQYNFNTQDDVDRTKVRMRLDLNAAVTDEVKVGVRMTTGNTTDRVSTNQTLGANFNKYSVVLDRVYLKWNPAGSEISYWAGRMPNPFFGTELVWDPDLNFEGLAATGDIRLGLRSRAFTTVGWFPLSTANPGSTVRKDLLGAQAGYQWQFGYTGANRWRVGLGVYDYRNIAGIKETQDDYDTRADYAVRSEYASGLRQRGNTLFQINRGVYNSQNTFDSPRFGLASEFRTVNLTTALELVDIPPVPVTLTADYIQNMGFNRSEIARRTTQTIVDGSNVGYWVGVQVGKRTIREEGDWSASLTYRRLGSDATLDAFADSDFGLGGTNNRGTILGMNYGLRRNVWLGARWLSSDLIHSFSPVTSTANLPSKFSVDVLQVDVNARF
jgi:hypothetical protein